MSKSEDTALNSQPSQLQSKLNNILGARQRLQTEEAQQLVSFACVGLTVFIDFMGLTIQNPLLPFYVSEFDDAKDLGVGLASSVLMASYGLSQLIATPIFGFASDRFGRRPMLLLSLFGTFVGFFAQGFARSFFVLCALRFITGLFSGTRPVAVAYIGDAFPADKQPKYMSFLALSVSVSMFLAPLIGGSLGLVHLSIPCFFQSGVAAVILLVAYRNLIESRPPQRGTGEASKGGPAAAAKENGKGKIGWRIWLLINAFAGLLAMCQATGWMSLSPVIASSELGMNQNDIGIMMATSGVCIMVAQLAIFVPLSRKMRLHILAILGSCMISSPCLLYFVEARTWVLFFVSCIQSAGMSLVLPTVTLTVNILSPADRRGGSVALTVTTQALGRVIAPLVFGKSYDINSRTPFLIMICVLAAQITLHILLSTHVRTIRAGGPPGKDASAAPDAISRGDSGMDEQKLKQMQQEKAELIENLYNVLKNLESREQELHQKVESIKAGESDNAAEPLPVKLEQKHELGIWLSDMLVEHNYKRWPFHMDTFKCLLQNAFPKIRRSDEKFVDLLFLIDSHIMLAQRWERYVVDRAEPWADLAGGLAASFAAPPVKRTYSMSEASAASHSDIYSNKDGSPCEV
jgi:DHA1 family tetracycline resistance protein-like MFS transporter